MPSRLNRLIVSLCVAASLPAFALASPEAGHDGHDMASHDKAGHDMHAGHKAQIEDKSGNKITPADVTIPDVVMLDQTGAERRMASDVIGDRIVVVDFIYTSCTTICPVTTALMARSKQALSDVSGDEVAFVSMSIDSNTDTPARLTEFAARAHADWTFLTGEKRVMDDALTGMDAYATNPEDHAPMIIIGDPKSGEFIRVFGLPNPDMVAAKVRDFVSKRSDAMSGHQHHH